MSAIYFDAYTHYGPTPHTHGAQPWRLDQLLDELTHCSISAALVASKECLHYDAMWGNRRLVETLGAHDHLFPIWNVTPHWTGECPEPTRLTELMREHNVPAVELHPTTNGWDVLSTTSEPLLRELERQQIPTIIQINAEICPRELEKLLTRYAALPIVVRGATWGQQRQIVPLLIQHKNLHITMDHFQIHYGPEWLVELGCADQLLFGSNATDMSIGAHRCYIDYADIPDATRTKIASGNLIRLLHGVEPPREVVNSHEDELMRAVRHGEPMPTHVLDIHAHVLDEGLNGPGTNVTMHRGGPEGVIALAKRMGVDGVGLMSWNGTVGVQAADGNACTTAALDVAPESWWGLGTFDVLHDSPETMRMQMESLYADPRFLGLKPYPAYGIRFDDPRYDVWWQFGNERGLYTLWHPTLWWEKDEFENTCGKYPNLTFVGAHVGGSYEIADKAIDLAKQFDNFHMEVTLTPSCMGVVDYLVAGAGEDRVMYGSDMPMRDPRQQMGWVVFSRLPVETKQKVLGGNAQRILDRVRANQRRQTKGAELPTPRRAIDRTTSDKMGITHDDSRGSAG